MAGMNVLGNVVESPGKKGKETSVPYSPLLDEPAMHVFIGEDGSGHDEALRTLVENVLGNGHKVIALDTRGAITPFIVPFLPGGHLKKVRGMKEKVSGDIVALVRPVVVFFNSVVEENPGTICKVTFPLVHLLLAACTLDQDGTRPVDVEIIPSFADHVKDALLAIIWVAFGKDFDKYKDKATLLVGYLHEVLKAVAAARAEPSWKVLKEALLGHPPPGFPDVGATTSLAASEMQSFIFTLDYYISNSLIFNDRGPALSKVNSDTIYHANLLLFYLQDLSDRERVLVATLLGLQQALERHQGALPPGGMITQFSSDGISPAAPPVSLALDELSLAFPSDPAIPLVHRALQGMLFSGITRGGSLFLGTGRPKELSDTAIDTLLAKGIRDGLQVCHFFMSRMKDKEMVSRASSSLSKGGVNVDEAMLGSLKSSHVLHCATSIPVPVLFEPREAISGSIDLSPALLKKMLLTPILVASAASPASPASPAHSSPASGVTTQHSDAPATRALAGQVAGDRPGQETIPEPVHRDELPRDGVFPAHVMVPGSASTNVASIKRDIPGDEEHGTPEAVTRTSPVATPGTGAGKKEDAAMSVPAAAADGAVIPGGTPSRVDGPLLASAPTGASKDAGATYEGGFAEEEIPEDGIHDDGDDLTGLLDSIESGEFEITLDDDFLARLLHARSEPITLTTSDGKVVSGFDYNIVLNALLFKLERVIKAPFGLDFFKELAFKRSLPFERAASMYFQETMAVVKGGFAVQEGDNLVYKGVKSALLSVVNELGLEVTLPSDAELTVLEKYLAKALELPKNELLSRIKDGSLYF